MYDDHEHEHDLDQPPEGSIVTPIFLGCGAMGIGCLLSGGLIAIALAVFAPGLWNFISNLEDPFAAQAFAHVEVHPEVIEALGEPMTYNLEDVDLDSDETEVSFGDIVDLTTNFAITGPNGSAMVEAVSTQEVSLRGNQELHSVIVTLDDGREIRVFPAEGDAPPPPRQLAPPEDVAPANDNAIPATPAQPETAPDGEGEASEEGGEAAMDSLPEKEPTP